MTDSEDPRERTTLEPPLPSIDTDPSELTPTCDTRSSLPGQRPTIDLVLERVQCVPELLKMVKEMFETLQTFQHSLEERISAVERRVTLLEWWREDMGRKAAKPLGR